MSSIDPGLRREALVAAACTVAASCAVGAALTLSVGAAPTAPLKAAALPLILGPIVWPSLAEHGHPTLGPANGITLGRAVVAAALAAFVADPVARSVPWLLVGAGSCWFALDWVDGRVARSTGFASAFGARLDMELDALTILTLSILVWQLDRAGAWVLLSGLLRYLFVAAAWVAPSLDRPLFPSLRRAVVCGVQVTCLVAALAPWPAPGIATALAASGLAALIYSFGVDTAWLLRRRDA